MNARTYLTANDAEADRRKLADLLDGAVDAMPADTDPAEYADVAYVLTAKMLTGAARLGLLPLADRAGMLAECHAALASVAKAESLAAFQAAAKEALRTPII